MRVPVIDQTYYLAVRDQEGPAHDPDPAGPEMFWIEPHRDYLYVQCIDEETDIEGVELLVDVVDDPVGLNESAELWPHRMHGEWEVSGPVVVCTLEGEQIAEVFDGPGRYGFVFIARIAQGREPGSPAEEHCVTFWPLDGQAFSADFA